MNRFFTLLTVAMCGILAMVSCENQSSTTKLPKINVTLNEIDSNSATITINAVDADECAYMLYDGDVITAEQVLANGTKLEEHSSSIELENLEPETTYYVIAAARNGAGVTLSNSVKFTTAKDDNGGGNNGGGNNGGDNGGGDNNQTELPEIDGVENVVITKTRDGRWYEPYNFYVTLVRDNGDHIILDFYTLDETMSSYLPYGQYSLANSENPYVIHNETSRYVPVGVEAIDGHYFTDGFVTVDVVGGYYSLYFMLTYDDNGTSKTIQGLYNGLLSGASVPEGDNQGAKKLIEVLDVGSTSFKFRINAEEGQYWRCSVVDKRVYDQYQSNPGAWVVNYGFMLEGPLTFNWVNGEICEHVPGLVMEAMSSTDYLILAALMDYSDGQENNLMSGVEVVQVRTEKQTEGVGKTQINIKDIQRNDITFDCILDENAWSCYVALLPTQRIEEIKSGEYTLIGFSSYEECMISLIPALGYDNKRQFMTTTYDYKWEYLNYNTSYTMLVLTEDMNKGVTFYELEPFTTK